MRRRQALFRILVGTALVFQDRVYAALGVRLPFRPGPKENLEPALTTANHDKHAFVDSSGEIVAMNIELGVFIGAELPFHTTPQSIDPA